MNERGMMKWKPFVSIVEQQQAISQVLNDMQKIERPVLDESQHEENARCVLCAYYSQQTVEISYYEQGVLNQYKGRVDKLNEAYRYFILVNETTGIKKRLVFDGIIRAYES